MKTKRLLPALAYMLGVMLLCGCSGIAPELDPYTLRIHMGAEPGTLNPITATDSYAHSINLKIYETLVDRDYDTLDVKPMLAERWEISPDHLKFRFYLKKGIVWSDGAEFTADDVVYSYDRIMDPKVSSAQLKVYYIDIQSCKKIDRYTVEFTYSRPYYLALIFCGGMPIVPKHIFNNGTDFNTHKNNRFPIGTGPFRFERWDTGKNIILVRNERYRGAKPEIRRVVYKIISEGSVALQMLKKGEIDLMGVRDIEWVRQTNSKKFTDNFYKLKYYMPSFSYIGWNSQRPFFKDRRVRLAMTHLINRKEILGKLLFGLGEIVTGPFYIFGKANDPGIRPWPYDPERAKQLLTEAGWVDHDGDGILDKDGKKFSFTFTISSGSKFAERLVSILKEDFGKVGIEMDINRYEWAVYLDKIQSKNFDATSLGWSDPDFQDDPYQIWHSSQIKGGSNYIGFSNREADRIIEAARTEFNEAKRNRMYHRFHRILHDEQPYTFMYTSPALAVVSKRFTNVKVHTRGMNYLEWKVRKPQ
ncbi:MAG TPA: peptide-binding protein [Spirochaetota bacterium]|nr:peptide-binding protein [Spirochaetota bacterium]HPC40846.1 peptide-binding protein [Spirochaetota bacterium]HPL17449.1 peptide-binding protein [Spirochaetota bacterium]HQF07764.1 peptide-binding protein [Spirochaetota bacterium]HQH96817.1 peptide-binding protein [Spirochaetota bacterium]